MNSILSNISEAGSEAGSASKSSAKTREFPKWLSNQHVKVFCYSDQSNPPKKLLSIEHFLNMVKTPECFSHMPLIEKGCYLQFYKGTGGTDPTERGTFVGGCTESRTIQLPLNQCEWGLRKDVVGQIWVWVWFFHFLLTKKKPQKTNKTATGERTAWCSDLSPLFSLV